MYLQWYNKYRMSAVIFEYECLGLFTDAISREQCDLAAVTKTRLQLAVDRRSYFNVIIQGKWANER